MDICDDIPAVKHHFGRPKKQVMRPSKPAFSIVKSHLTPPLRPTSFSTFLGTSSNTRDSRSCNEESQVNHCTYLLDHTFFSHSPVQLLNQHINDKNYKIIKKMNCEDSKFDYIQMGHHFKKAPGIKVPAKQKTLPVGSCRVPAEDSLWLNNLFIAKVFLVFGLFLTSLCLPSALVVSKHYLRLRNLTNVDKVHETDFHLQVLTSSWFMFPADGDLSTKSPVLHLPTPTPSSQPPTQSSSLNFSATPSQSGFKNSKKNFTNTREKTYKGNDVTRVNQSTYAILSEPCSFSTCQQRCRDKFGGHLAHAQSIREQLFLEVFLQKSDENLDWVAAYWLGAKKKNFSMQGCAEGVWDWVDGEDRVVSELQGWSAFVPGRPDNYNDNEDCLVMTKRNGLQDDKYLKWDDVPCNANFDIYGPIKGICEIDIGN